MKNRYVGKLRLSIGGKTLDVAEIKTKRAKGKDYFLNEVSKTLATIVQTANASPDTNFDVEYQGDFGEDFNAAVVEVGGKCVGIRKGTLAGVA